MKRLLFIFSILSALLLTGCKVPQQEYNGFKVGEFYQTEVDAYVVFGYATFIWQNPRDWQEIGVLMSFPEKISDENKKNLTILKGKGSLEMKRCFNYSWGGLVFFIPKGLVYKIDLTVKRCLPARRNVDYSAEKRDVLRFKRVPSCTEQIERLTVGKEHSFLRFVDDQLRSCVEIFARMLPYKGAIVAFIFDNIRYMHNKIPFLKKYDGLFIVYIVSYIAHIVKSFRL